MMRSALYYPHTQLQDEGGERLLKRALLLWDELEFIVPYPEYQAYYSDPVIAEAAELIGHNHCPTEDEKKRAHTDIEEIVTRPRLPDAFYFNARTREPYEVYPQKFLPDTWDMLMHTQLAGQLLPNYDYPLSPVAGLCIMGILADACAGTTRARITDREAAYASVTGLLGSDRDVEGEVENRERVVACTLRLLNLENVSLRSLIDFRKKEAKESGHSLRDLRHRYVERIDSYLKRISDDTALTSSDLILLERQFESDMRDDLAVLKSELRREFEQALWSKEVIACLIAGAGAALAMVIGAPIAVAGVVTASGVPVTLGGIFSSRSKFLKSRAEILRKHPMAYLYEAAGGTRL